MSKQPRPPKSTVILEGLNESGEPVARYQMSFEDYYEGSVAVIDESAHRKARGIRILHGRIYDLDRALSQEFTTYYDADGELRRSHVKHADGTVHDESFD